VTPAADGRALPPADRLLRVIDAQRDLACARPDAHQIFDLLARSVLAVFDADGALAAQPEDHNLVVRGVAGDLRPAMGSAIPLTGSLSGLAVRTRRPQISFDVDTDTRVRQPLRRPGVRSAIVVPLLDGDEVIGLVGAVAGRPCSFTEADLGLLDCLTDVAGAALRSALLVTEKARLADVSRDVERARHTDTARLRAAQELTGLAWWSLDLTTGAHEWSDAMFRLVGLEPGGEPPDHQRFLALLHPGDRAAAETLAGGGFRAEHQETFRVVHPGGAIRVLQSWHDVERDAEGRSVRVIGATMDVTEREKAVAELARSRASLAAALELTRTATWEWDVVANEVSWSPRMRELMGRAGDGKPIQVEDFLACVHPQDRGRIRALGERTITTGVAEEVEYRVLHPDGTVRVVRALTDVRLGSDGTVLALWGTAVDVTEQREAAARLAASERHFRTAFENAPIGMAMIDMTPGSEGRYLQGNAEFLAMLGYRTEELAGRSTADLTHPDDVERDCGLLARLSAGELEQVSFEKRYLRRDGAVLHAWLTTAIARDHRGEPLFLLSHALDLTDRLRKEAELERLALTDTLTGLANRTLLTDRIDQALARLQRTGGACAMLLLDIDRFKVVNDSLGHLVGDALLVEVAGRISDVSRADSTVARLGGDEFVVLVEGLADPQEVHGIAARLLATLRRPYDLGPLAESLVATVSIGISVATTPDRTHVDLYREADLALYRAKDAGRDQHALFDEDLRARAEARLAAERLVRRAVTEDAIVPVFQPMVDLADGRAHAVEALARIDAGDGRLALPAGFIEVAEDTGLIVDIDARMFELAIAHFARWSADPAVQLRRVSTNVSARSLEDPTFVDRLGRALRWYGVPGSALRIELTERSLLTTSPVALRSLQQLAEMGLAVGLDDFGTGYSALAYLQRFALQFLKIDRSFVGRLGCSPSDDAVVRAVIDLAHAHDLVVVAEGVETTEQLAALRDMGCDRAQGYLLGRPVRAEDVPAALAAVAVLS